MSVSAERRRVAVATLGCKVNLYESEWIAERLTGKDYQRVSAAEIADLYIINSCTVTAEADRQTRQLARKFKRLNPAAEVVVTGCYAQTQPERLAALDAVDLVVGNAAKAQIPVLVNEREMARFAVAEQRSGTALAPIIRPDFDAATGQIGLDPDIGLPAQLLSGYQNHSRAFLQIQQGCDRGCTFCIIHTARGPSRSFPVASVVQQYRQLVEEGYHEVVLCGVDLGAWGADLPGAPRLSDLLEAMLNQSLDCRVRISSIDPAHLDDALIQLIGDERKICRHVHLSLQSGNTLILKRMKRRAGRDQIEDRVAKLRASCPKIVLSADVIVGFPTETEAQFADTLSAVKAFEIAYPHVFPYSRREGTPAARIPNQIAPAEIKHRARMLRQAGAEVWKTVAARWVGEELTAIVEQGGREVFARCDHYFPVRIDMGQAEHVGQEGDWINLRVVGWDADAKTPCLLGELR